MLDFVRLCLTLYDSIWLCQTLFDFVKLCLTLSNFVWLCLFFFTLLNFVWLWLTYVAMHKFCAFWTEHSVSIQLIPDTWLTRGRVRGCLENVLKTNTMKKQTGSGNQFFPHKNIGVPTLCGMSLYLDKSWFKSCIFPRSVGWESPISQCNLTVIYGWQPPLPQFPEMCGHVSLTRELISTKLPPVTWCQQQHWLGTIYFAPEVALTHPA